MKSAPMPLIERLELAAQACRAAHLLSCEATCREAITALSESLPQLSTGGNSGHGHVWARPDGIKARCGGPGVCAECSRDKTRLNTPASSERATNAALQEVEDALWTLHSYESNRDDAGRSYSEAEITKMVSAIRALAPNSASRATDLLKEVRPYLDLIAPSVSKKRPLVMVTTKCDAEALAKRIDAFIGEPS